MENVDARQRHTSCDVRAEAQFAAQRPLVVDMSTGNLGNLRGSQRGIEQEVHPLKRLFASAGRTMPK